MECDDYTAIQTLAISRGHRTYQLPSPGHLGRTEVSLVVAVTTDGDDGAPFRLQSILPTHAIYGRHEGTIDG